MGGAEMSPDYARWALVHNLTVYQAACLIAETEPTIPLLSSPLVDAIYDELLPYARRLNLEYELRNDITREIPLSDGDLKLTRDELLDYFTRKIEFWDKIGPKPTIPRFLSWPEPTINSQENNDNNKHSTGYNFSKDKTKPETYLRIIRALSNLILYDTDDNGVPLCKLPRQKRNFPSQNELIAHLVDRNPLNGAKESTLKTVYAKANKLQDFSLTAEDLDSVFTEIKDLGDN